MTIFVFFFQFYIILFIWFLFLLFHSAFVFPVYVYLVFFRNMRAEPKNNINNISINSITSSSSSSDEFYREISILTHMIHKWNQKHKCLSFSMAHFFIFSFFVYIFLLFASADYICFAKRKLVNLLYFIHICWQMLVARKSSFHKIEF